MVFTKSFPKSTEKYTKWEEVFLSDEEEEAQEILARDNHVEVMRDSIADAKEVAKQSGLKGFQSDIVRVAIALFEKRASHVVFFKESKAKEKFQSR